MTSAGRVAAALKAQGFGGFGVEANPATPGEVVVWAYGVGYPVYSVRAAVDIARSARAEQEALAGVAK